VPDSVLKDFAGHACCAALQKNDNNQFVLRLGKLILQNKNTDRRTADVKNSS
jgi:hypothetical protein